MNFEVLLQTLKIEIVCSCADETQNGGSTACWCNGDLVA